MFSTTAPDPHSGVHSIIEQLPSLQPLPLRGSGASLTLE
ncbi:hypothetical protein VP150E351_P0157 [Vibrio phage 150E35-1]|nr:hypothetical protein VP150E351_P0157 [Vibrio phage 150E35-1]